MIIEFYILNAIIFCQFDILTKLFLEIRPNVEVVSIMHRTVDTQTSEIINYPVDRDAEREGKLG